MRESILHIENLGKSFGGLKLFDDVNLTLNEGTINALFGNNGSGKTTFFNLLGGYEKPGEGKIYFKGLLLNYYKAFEIAKVGIGKMWQEPAVFPNHSVLENLLVSDKANPGERFFNYLFKGWSVLIKERELKDKATAILRKFGLQEKSAQLAGTLSLGERKLLSIAMLLMNEATLFLLDEPFSAVNPGTIERISEVLNELKIQGKTVFMIEHKVKIAEAISDNTFKIQNYRIEKLS